MEQAKFYRCAKCGHTVVVVKDACDSLTCCGEKMELVEANSVDAAREKHVPVVERGHDGHGLKVSVGEVEHPMAPEHYIEWIALAAQDRIEVHYLKPGDKPTTFFGGVEHGWAYASCNLHGLWKAQF